VPGARAWWPLSFKVTGGGRFEFLHAAAAAKVIDVPFVGNFPLEVRANFHPTYRISERFRLPIQLRWSAGCIGVVMMLMMAVVVLLSFAAAHNATSRMVRRCPSLTLAA